MIWIFSIKPKRNSKLSNQQNQINSGTHIFSQRANVPSTASQQTKNTRTSTRRVKITPFRWTQAINPEKLNRNRSTNFQPQPTFNLRPSRVAQSTPFLVITTEVISKFKPQLTQTVSLQSPNTQIVTVTTQFSFWGISWTKPSKSKKSANRPYIWKMVGKSCSKWETS